MLGRSAKCIHKAGCCEGRCSVPMRLLAVAAFFFDFDAPDPMATEDGAGLTSLFAHVLHYVLQL